MDRFASADRPTSLGAVGNWHSRSPLGVIQAFFWEAWTEARRAKLPEIRNERVAGAHEIAIQRSTTGAMLAPGTQPDYLSLKALPA